MSDKPCTIADAVEYVLAHLSADDRAAFAVLDEDSLITLHHGLGTWLRNELLWPRTPAALALQAECAAILQQETAARREADPFLASIASKLEPLRPPPHIDDMGMIIIHRVWERLRAATSRES